MDADRPTDGDHDFVVCAEVLGAFGVPGEHVRRQSEIDARSLETAIASALDSVVHPTEYLRRTIATSDRGVDVPARYRQSRFWDALADVFDTLEWALSVDRTPGDAVELTVTDGTGSTRELSVSYPDTPLGRHNAPAIVYWINARLLYDLECEFVLLSAGTDRWQLALVETPDLDRLREGFGERVEGFDRTLLPATQPAAYVPEATDGTQWTDGTQTTDETTATGGREVTWTTDEPVPLPPWAVDDPPVERPRGRNESDGGSQTALDRSIEAGGDSRETDDETTTDEGDLSDVIDFVSATDEPSAEGSNDADRSEDVDARDGWSSASSIRQAERRVSGDRSEHADPATAADRHPSEEHADPATAADRHPSEKHADPATAKDSHPFEEPDDETSPAATPNDDATATSGSSPDTGEFEVGGRPKTVSLSTGDPLDALDSDADTHTDSDAAPDHGVDRGADSSVDREGESVTGSGPDAGSESSPSSAGDPPETTIGDESPETGEYGFEDGASDALAGSVSTVRVENDSFGVDEGELDEETELTAYGAAMTAPADLSVKGLLAEEDFVPEFPSSGPSEVRLEFQDDFDPSGPSPADTRETEDGFVWVNEGSLSESRHSTLE